MEYTELLHGVAELLKDAGRRRLLDAERLNHARALAREGKAAEAVAAYQFVLKTLKHDAAAWHELATLQITLGDVEQALASLIQSIAADHTRTLAHHDFGRVCAEHPCAGDVAWTYLAAFGAAAIGDRLPADRASSDVLISAEAHYRRALPPEPSPEDSLRLAHLQAATLHVMAALETLRAAVAAGHRHAAIFSALSVLSRIAGSDQESQIYRGHADYVEGRYGQAVESYRAVLDAGPAEAIVHARLAASYSALHQFTAGIEACRQGLTHHPDDDVLSCLWAELLHADGQTDESRRVAAAASARCPGSFMLKKWALLTLPIVYDTPDAIARERCRYAEGLDTLSRQLLVEGSLTARGALKDVGPNFFLAYQGRDDRALQVQYGALVHHIARETWPQWCQPISMPPLAQGERIRVGYVSANLRRHTVAKLFLGWLQAHDKTQVEIFAYHLGARIDPMTHQYERAADHFRQFQGSFEATCRQVIEDRLHVLVYLDVGMDAIVTQCASLRLAPVQCAAWGHPVTTGLPTLDYFISNALMEPDGADEHYSETLIRLPGIGLNVPPPHLDEAHKARVDFGLRDDDCVYLSPQSIFKYLPQYDDLFPRIALRVPRAKFVFLRAGSDIVTNARQARLLSAFSAHGLDGREFLVVLPTQGHRDYLALNCAADVFLDQPGWSGGMTALEALGCGLPVVTWPGAFMRGRHSAAFLRRMGLEDTIAADLDGLVDIAARLGTDAAWRQALRHEIAARRHLLFNDASSAADLERFYSRVVAAKLNT